MKNQRFFKHFILKSIEKMKLKIKDNEKPKVFQAFDFEIYSKKMKLKIKDMDIATGGPLIVVLNKKDAMKFDIYHLDRIKIKKGKKIETVVVDIAQSGKAVPEGSIGAYEEVISSLRLKNGDIVSITLARKPISIEFIRKKLDDKKLSKKEIDQIVWDIVHNKLSEVELTYFVAACYTNLMSINETMMLTKAISKHGDTLKLDRYPVVDKHSIGGIPGNRTTMVLVPIVAAAGLTIPKTSSRSITSPAGTADTMEVLAKVSFSIKKMKQIVMKTNGCIVWGGSLNLAPADDKIINVERTLEIDAESQLLASIMAKKHSVSSTHILIDIPTSKESKIKSKEEAFRLKKLFEVIGKKLRKHIKVIITDGREPIGNGIGPALEARDVLWLLKRDKRRPFDLEKKCVLMAAEIFKMAGIKDCRNKTMELLNSGKAYKKMKEIIKAQDGNVFNPNQIKIGRFKYDIRAGKKGIVKNINNRIISRIARIAGAPINKGAGIYLYKRLGNDVKKGEKLYTVYAESRQKLKFAKDFLKDNKAYKIK
ncbi:AMP phosphorylase [Candidatus Woesearchaeota archaeon]|nr:AMP phosphorylase [Candidatus Woesearchaeota archaeon]